MAEPGGHEPGRQGGSIVVLDIIKIMAMAMDHMTGRLGSKLCFPRNLETYPCSSAFDWGRGRAATEEGEERVKEADGVVVMIYHILVIVAIKVAAFSCLRGCAGFQE